MLSVPTLAQMLSVIGVTLLATTVLIVLATLAFSRVRSTVKPTAAIAQVPAQRSGRRKTPVTTH